MTDYAAARRMMVDGQVRTSDVTDLRIIAAMLELPRERFLPEGKSALAYLDLDVPVDGSRSRRLLKPMVLARLLQAAEIDASDRVLDVGCATGYASAVLAQLADAVVALEEDPALAQRAGENLQAIGIGNVTVVTGALTEGCTAQAPYDVIVLNGATEIAPKMLFRQLKDGGRLVGVLGGTPPGKAMLYRAAAGEVSGRAIFDATAPLLPGFAAKAEFAF